MILQEKIKEKAERYGQLAPVFLEGAEFTIENLWISVEDDLPCNHKELIIDKETLPVISLSQEGIICLSKMQKVNGDWCWRGAEPTYWFPIPELPKEL